MPDDSRNPDSMNINSTILCILILRPTMFPLHSNDVDWFSTKELKVNNSQKGTSKNLIEIIIRPRTRERAKEVVL